MELLARLEQVFDARPHFDHVAWLKVSHLSSDGNHNCHLSSGEAISNAVLVCDGSDSKHVSFYGLS
jgi:hypothetical protein